MIIFESFYILVDYLNIGIEHIWIDMEPSEIKKAILVVLMYSSKLNDEIYRIAGFTPFGSMKGFKGRLKPLNKTTTKWLIQGIGFGRKES